MSCTTKMRTLSTGTLWLVATLVLARCGSDGQNRAAPGLEQRPRFSDSELATKSLEVIQRDDIAHTPPCTCDDGSDAKIMVYTALSNDGNSSYWRGCVRYGTITQNMNQAVRCRTIEERAHQVDANALIAAKRRIYDMDPAVLRKPYPCSDPGFYCGPAQPLLELQLDGEKLTIEWPGALVDGTSTPLHDLAAELEKVGFSFFREQEYKEGETRPVYL